MAGGYITDPRLIAELEDRALAERVGVNYDRVSQSTEAKRKRKQGMSIFDVSAQYGKRDSFGQGVLEGIGDYVSGGSQAISRGLNTVGAKIPGVSSDIDAEYYDAVAKARGTRLDEEGSTLGRLVGNVAVPVPGMGKLRALGGARGALAQGAATGALAAVAQPVQERSDSFLADKASQASLGAIFGAGANYGLDKLGKLSSRGTVPGARQVRMAAGERQGIPLSMAEASDSSVLRAASDISSNLPGGGSLVRQGKNSADLFEQRATNAAGAVGNIHTRAGLGEKAKKGIEDFTSRFETQSTGLYNQVTREVPLTLKVDMGSTRQAMKDTADMFPSAPGLGENLANSRLLKMAGNLTDDAGNAKPLFFNEAQRLRSEIGKMLGEPGLMNDIPRRELAKVYAALTTDMRAALQKDAPKALKTFDRATTFYKAGRNRISNVLEPMIQNSSDERIADKVLTMIKNDAKGVSALRRSLTNDEWDDVAATIFARLGDETPAWQGAAGTGFSVPSFLTDFNKLRSNPDAFSHAFGGTRYAALRDTYGDLATIADSIKQSKKLANVSRSGYTSGLIGLGGLLLTSPALAGKAIVSNMAFAKAMSSPRFARWMLKTGKIVNQGLRGNGKAAEAMMRTHLERLPAIGAANGDLQEATSGLYQYFLGGGQE